MVKAKPRQFGMLISSPEEAQFTQTTKDTMKALEELRQQELELERELERELMQESQEYVLCITRRIHSALFILFV